MQSAQEFLVEEFRKRREKNPALSMRSFARYLQISPAQLSQMMAGKRNTSLKILDKISQRIGLSPLEAQELLENQARRQFGAGSASEKKVLRLREDQFRVISDWYHFAILSLTKIPGAQPDARWVARRLGITTDEASQALSRLERMGIVQLTPEFKQICSPIEVVSEVPSAAIRKYHKQSLAMAADKLETVPVALREFQSIALNVDSKKLAVLKKQIDQFLESASQAVSRHKGEDVYHLNVQLFPVTTLPEESK